MGTYACLVHQRDTRKERREEKVASMGKAARAQRPVFGDLRRPAWKDAFGPNLAADRMEPPSHETDEEIVNLKVKDIAPTTRMLLWALPHMPPTATRSVRRGGFKYRNPPRHGVKKDRLGHTRATSMSCRDGRRGASRRPEASAWNR